MNKNVKIRYETLLLVLCKIFGTNIIHADYQVKQLWGGGGGDVKLLFGNAETVGGETLPYKVIYKRQKRKKNDSDSISWRREYDLYISDLNSVFDDSFRLPECYHNEVNDDEWQLWLEYTEGVSHDNLTTEMLECAAFELGRLQGRLHKQNPPLLRNISCFTEYDEFKEKHYNLASVKKKEYRFIRSDDCPIPEHLRKMIIDIDANAAQIFAEIEKLPVVLCHRDFWLGNIIYSNGKIILIDWSYSGLGYIGEDIVYLITAETEIEDWKEYYRRFVPAYFKGLSEYTDVSINNSYIWEMLVLKYGYKLIRRYIESDGSSDEKNELIESLQKIYEMKNIQLY